MNFWDKLKARFRKESRVAGVVSTQGTCGAMWTPNDYENFANETYLKNVTAYKAIDEVAKSVASVPWAEYQHLDDNKRERITDSDVADVLRRPNPSEGLSYVMLKATAFLVMSGNAFFERVGPSTGENKGQIRELYALRPDRFKMKTNSATGQLRAYEYAVNSRATEWEIDPITGHCDILHLKAFHPLDDFWGAAATEPAAREIDTSNAATEWNKSILDNQGRPGMVFTLVGATGEQAMDKLEQHLRDEHTGPANAGKNLIIAGDRGTKAEPWGFSPSDLDFNEGDLRLMRKIAMGYGVPPELLGIQDATYNNRAEARLYFWENTVFFYLNYIRDELNNWLYEKGSDRFVDYILDNVPALALKRDLLWGRAQKSDFLKINEKREMVGLDPDPNGDVILTPASMIPLGSVGVGDEEEEEEEARKELIDQGYTDDEINEMFGLPRSSA
jgi:HK97 family phage portal protein